MFGSSVGTLGPVAAARTTANRVAIGAAEDCLLSDDIYEYHFVSQGKTTIPNVDDAEELTFTDVSAARTAAEWSTSSPDREQTGAAECVCD